MLDIESRLIEARQALHSLELQIEQCRIHISELSAHPAEAERAQAMLAKMQADLAAQRTYCELLANADHANSGLAKNGARVA